MSPKCAFFAKDNDNLPDLLRDHVAMACSARAPRFALGKREQNLVVQIRTLERELGVRARSVASAERWIKSSTASTPNVSRAEGMDASIAEAKSSAENHPSRSAATKQASEAPDAWLICSASFKRVSD